MKNRGFLIWSGAVVTMAMATSAIGAIYAKTKGHLNVFLDDERKCLPGFQLARSFDSCIRLLEENRVDILSLDHDLGADRNGYDVATWIVENDCWPKIVNLHTANPFGRRRMLQLLQKNKPQFVTLSTHSYAKMRIGEPKKRRNEK